MRLWRKAATRLSVQGGGGAAVVWLRRRCGWIRGLSARFGVWWHRCTVGRRGERTGSMGRRSADVAADGHACCCSVRAATMVACVSHDSGDRR
uniref:Uncharacterized protein n=1 Tax=Arundo donax TaxID=35708 RepID=A0A0A9BVI4_ARUDO